MNQQSKYDISAIDLEVAIAEILLNADPSVLSLADIYKVFRQNQVKISRQLLHYYLKRMVKLGTILEAKRERDCFYSLPASLYDTENYITIINQIIASLKIEDVEISIVIERLILLVKVAVDYMIRGKEELESDE